jgi:hypothetical protein
VDSDAAARVGPCRDPAADGTPPHGHPGQAAAGSSAHGVTVPENDGDVRADFMPVSRHPAVLGAPECRVPSTKWVGVRADRYLTFSHPRRGRVLPSWSSRLR